MQVAMNRCFLLNSEKKWCRSVLYKPLNPDAPGAAPAQNEWGWRQNEKLKSMVYNFLS